MPVPPARVLRPSMQILEGRVLLSRAPMATETLYFESPSLVSQQTSTEATLTLKRQGLPKFDGGYQMVGRGRIDDTLVVHVTTRSPDPASPPDATPADIDLGGGRVAHAATYPPLPVVMPPNGNPGGQDGSYETATPNVQYVPVDQTITFEPNEASKTITIPIIPGAANPGLVTVHVDAVPATTRATMASTQFFISNKAGADTPRIISSQLVVAGRKATGIALQFNKPMDVASVTNPAGYKVTELSQHSVTTGDVLNYLLFQKTAYRDKAVRIQSATWDASTNTVTLIPRRPLPAGGRFQVESRTVMPPRSAGHRGPVASQLANPLRDEAGNRVNEGAAFGGGFFSLTATRKATAPDF